MIEFKPEDIHISLYNAKGYKGSWDTYNKDNGVTIIHLPTGKKVIVSCLSYLTSTKKIY